MISLALTALNILASLTITVQELPSNHTAKEVQVIDARPTKQKVNGFESLNRMKCSYGSMRIGDKEFGRDRISLLAKAISNNSQSIPNRTIVVRNYVIHRNLAVDSVRIARKITAAQVGGAIGGVLAEPNKAPEVATVVGCSPDDLTGGYTTGENGIVNSPIVTVIDLEVDQRIFHFRSVSDTERRGVQGRSGRETGEANFERAQSETISKLIPALASFLESPASGG